MILAFSLALSHLTVSSISSNLPDSWIIWPSNLVNTTTKGTVKMSFIGVAPLDNCHLSLSLYWRTQALQVGWGEYYPLVYSTYESMVSFVGKEWMSRYQIACNWSSSLVAVDFFSMKSQTTSISSFAPDSKPCESWKMKLLPSYVIWCSISCMPLWWYAIREYIYGTPLTHFNWWYQMSFRRFQFST